MSSPPLDLLTLTAYSLAQPLLPITPAPAMRAWMGVNAKRCLPLVIANQSGWFILNNASVRATWDGGYSLKSVQVEHRDEKTYTVSHFGDGVLTFTIPYLFQTSKGYNLLVRGPSNCVKDGIVPLEGIVETDWTPATFTMNWKFTRPGSVTFEPGEPICMVVPQERRQLEMFEAKFLPLASNPELMKEYEDWMESRAKFLIELQIPGSDAVKQGWQKDYFDASDKKLTLDTFD